MLAAGVNIKPLRAWWGKPCCHCLSDRLSHHCKVHVKRLFKGVPGWTWKQKAQFVSDVHTFIFRVLHCCILLLCYIPLSILRHLDFWCVVTYLLETRCSNGPERHLHTPSFFPIASSKQEQSQTLTSGVFYGKGSRGDAKSNCRYYTHPLSEFRQININKWHLKVGHSSKNMDAVLAPKAGNKSRSPQSPSNFCFVHGGGKHLLIVAIDPPFRGANGIFTHIPSINSRWVIRSIPTGVARNPYLTRLTSIGQGAMHGV